MEKAYQPEGRCKGTGSSSTLRWVNPYVLPISNSFRLQNLYQR